MFFDQVFGVGFVLKITFFLDHPYLIVHEYVYVILYLFGILASYLGPPFTDYFEVPTYVDKYCLFSLIMKY